MMIYNRELPPAVVFTWIQLRGLAWDRMETPQVSMAQLSDLTGKSQSTLYAHMALLRSWGALRMRPSVKGSIIVAFPADTGEFFLDGNSLPAQLAKRNLDSEKSDKDSEYLERDSENLDSRKLEKGDPPSPSSPLSQPNKDSVEEREGENLPKGKINQLDSSRGNRFRDSRNSEGYSKILEQNSENPESPRSIESPHFGEGMENEIPRSGMKSPFLERRSTRSGKDSQNNPEHSSDRGEGDPPSPSPVPPFAAGSPLSQPNKDSVEEREGENLDLSTKGEIKDLDLSQGKSPYFGDSTRRDSENQEINSDKLEIDSDKLEIDSEKMEKDSEYSEIESPFFGEDSEKQESDSKNSENLSLRSGDESPFFGDYSEILAESPKRSKRAEGEQDPVKIYQTLTGIRPNKPQRQQLKDQVHDSALWSATVEHWQSHGWNPKNIAGILDIYQRGGPAACLCARRKADSRDGSVSALNQLREEFK